MSETSFYKLSMVYLQGNMNAYRFSSNSYDKLTNQIVHAVARNRIAKLKK